MTPALPTPIDVGAMLDRGRWTPYQKALTLLAATAVMFDGFDLQILGFAIPSIMRDWHLARASFAPVAAIGLGGMALGSPLAGYLGDRIGRRVALILCVAVFGAATVATAFAPDLTWLAILRFLTGMGVGGALPNAAAFTAEFAPARRACFLARGAPTTAPGSNGVPAERHLARTAPGPNARPERDPVRIAT